MILVRLHEGLQYNFLQNNHAMNPFNQAITLLWVKQMVDRVSYVCLLISFCVYANIGPTELL